MHDRRILHLIACEEDLVHKNIDNPSMFTNTINKYVNPHSFLSTMKQNPEIFTD